MSRIPGRLSRPMALAMSLLLLALGGAAAQQEPPPRAEQRIEEEIAVRETSVVVELPDTLRDGRLGTNDFLVMVDGKLRRVTRAQPLSGDEPWSLVVYVDRVLAKADTQFPALLALAQRSGELAARGSIEVVVADPAPRTVLAATREPLRIREILSGLAGEARVARQGPDAERAATAALTSDAPDAQVVLRRQLDRLLTRLADRTTAGPRALLLVADGMDLPPEQVERLARVQMGAMTSAPAPSGAAALFVEASRLLAAYGWVTFAMPFRDLGDGPGEANRGTNETTRVRQSADYGDLSSTVPPMILQARPGGSPSALQLPRVIDLFVLPNLAPLRALAQPTAGTVVAFPEQLDFVLRGLGRRWEVSYESPESVNGRLSSFEVMVPASQVRPRTQRWIRSSTPEEITEARLRLLVGGGTPANDRAGALPATISAAAREDGLALHVEVAPFPSQGSPPAGPVRISHALVRQGGEIQIRHHLAPGIARPDQGWSRDLTIPLPKGTLGVAVIVEDLARARWSATMMAPGAAAGAAGPTR
ncbi:MAG TPA: hypothetical protein VEL74_20375 [Thermoanaerobaculia bacterium]|nr:hypothetical protein [Thermoanaerobaculia bacterium]